MIELCTAITSGRIRENILDHCLIKILSLKESL